MYAIISELDANSAVIVKDLWGRLHQACGLREIYNLPTPHLTWFAAESLDTQQAASIMATLAAHSCILRSYVFGLGIFSGERPVLYLPIVKSQAMIDLHREIWGRVQSYGDRANDYYSPSHWLPHITLALKDLTRKNLACALESIVFESVEITLTIDNFLIVAEEGAPNSEVLHRFSLSGQGSFY